MTFQVAQALYDRWGWPKHLITWGLPSTIPSVHTPLTETAKAVARKRTEERVEELLDTERESVLLMLYKVLNARDVRMYNVENKLDKALEREKE